MGFLEEINAQKSKLQEQVLLDKKREEDFLEMDIEMASIKQIDFIESLLNQCVLNERQYALIEQQMEDLTQEMASSIIEDLLDILSQTTPNPKKQFENHFRDFPIVYFSWMYENNTT